jgi:hypothetical protein
MSATSVVRAPALRSTVLLPLVIAVLLGTAPALRGQSTSGEAAPAHVSVVDGEATLSRDVESVPADMGMPLVPGDRLRTGRGRAEVLFPDGSVLDLDEFTTLDVQAPWLLRLTGGRVRLTVPREATSRFQIDMPAASVRVEVPGEYRVSVFGSSTYPQSELAVSRGSADLLADRGSVRLQAGERSTAWANDVPSRPEPFNAARSDTFDRWASALHDDRSGGRSAQYLPPDLRVYGATLDQYGTWQYDTSYGYIWYPAVDAAWRPYYSGYWASVPSYGWTWIGTEYWAWPTHHYGRWGYGRNQWFWIPERHWAPAWVSWGAAPGYVGWCPVGFDNRPVFSLSMSGGIGRGGWVALPREHFGVRGEYVHRYAVEPRAFSARTPLTMQSSPPVAPPRVPTRRIVGAQPGGDVQPPRLSDPGRPGTAGGAPPSGRGPASSAPPRPAPPGNAASAPRAGTGAQRAPEPANRQPGPANRGVAPAPAPQGPPSSPAVSAPQRWTPFGDFRRRDAADAPPPAAGPETSTRGATSAARQGAVTRPGGSSPSPQPAPPPPPQSPSVQSSLPAGRAVARPPSGSGVGVSGDAPRSEPSGRGTGRASEGGRGGGGGRGDSGAAGAGQRPSGGQSQPSSRGGSGHAPESRHPPRQ